MLSPFEGESPEPHPTTSPLPLVVGLQTPRSAHRLAWYAWQPGGHGFESPWVHFSRPMAACRAKGPLSGQVCRPYVGGPDVWGVPMRRFIIALALPLALSLVSPPPAAAIWDPHDVRGPLDIRWVHVKELDHGRLKVTIGFWPGFDRSALPTEVFRRNAAWVNFLPEGFTRPTTAHVLRRDGTLKLVHGDFGSSLCCWGSRLIRIAPQTFTTRILPYWVRELDRTNSGVHFWGRSRACHPQSCRRDTTSHDVLP